MNRHKSIIERFLINLDEASADTETHPIPAPDDPKNIQDSLASISHLADTVAHNMGHARSHVLAGMAALNAKDYTAAAWNFDHGQKHQLEAEKHAAKLVKHIKDHPRLANALSEIEGVLKHV